MLRSRFASLGVLGRGVVVGALVTLLPAIPAGPALPAAPSSVPATIEVTVHAGRVTLRAENTTALEALRAIGERAGIAVSSEGGDLDAPRTAWSLTDVPILEAIRRIVGDRDLAMVGPALDGAGVVTLEASRLMVFPRPRGYPALATSSLPADGDWVRPDDTRGRAAHDVAALGEVLQRAPDPAARIAAVAALEATGGDAAASALEGGLGDGDSSVRVQVIAALERTGSHRAVATLGQTLFGDRDALVRLAAVQAIARHRSEAARAFLEAAGRDPDSRVRDAARLALAGGR